MIAKPDRSKTTTEGAAGCAGSVEGIQARSAGSIDRSSVGGRLTGALNCGSLIVGRALNNGDMTGLREDENSAEHAALEEEPAPANAADGHTPSPRYTRKSVAAALDERAPSPEALASFGAELERQLNLPGLRAGDLAANFAVDLGKNSSVMAAVSGVQFPIATAGVGNMKWSQSVMPSVTGAVGDLVKNSGLADVVNKSAFAAAAMPAVVGIDWSKVMPAPTLGLPLDLVNNSGLMNAINTMNEATRSSLVSRGFEIPEELETSMGSAFAERHGLDAKTMEASMPQLPDLAPNPIHETNRMFADLLMLSKAEREANEIERERSRVAAEEVDRARKLEREEAARALATEKREREQDRIRQHRKDVRGRWWNAFTVSISLVSLGVAVFKMTH